MSAIDGSGNTDQTAAAASAAEAAAAAGTPTTDATAAQATTDSYATYFDESAPRAEAPPLDVGASFLASQLTAQQLPESIQEAVDSASDWLADQLPDSTDALLAGAEELLRDAHEYGEDVVTGGGGIPGLTDDICDQISDALGCDALETREITSDASDANHLTKTDIRDATRQLSATAGPAKTALSNLSADDQAQYQAVMDTLSGPTASGEEVVAQAALQQMLVDGRIPGEEATGGEGDLLDQLASMTSQDLASGLDRSELLRHTVLEVEDPTRMAQEDKGTCGATSAAIIVANDNPAEYVRLVGGLATPEGEVALANGDVIAREPDWPLPGDTRTASGQLLFPALMEYATGDALDYDNAKDEQQADLGSDANIGLNGGLFDSQEKRLLEGLTGKSYEDHMVVPGFGEGALDEIQTATDNGEAVVASLRWKTSDDDDLGGHYVVITNVTADTVEITNPWGKTESFSREEFGEHLMSYHIPEAN